jgi:hypothetical protein
MLLSIDRNTRLTHKKTGSRLQTFGLDKRGLQNILFKTLDRLFPDDELILGGDVGPGWRQGDGRGAMDSYDLTGRARGCVEVAGLCLAGKGSVSGAGVGG